MSDKWLITSSGQLLFFCLLCVSILLVSCERRDLTYYEVSEITLTADWNDSGLDDKEQKLHFRFDSGFVFTFQSSFQCSQCRLDSSFVVSRQFVACFYVTAFGGGTVS